MTEYFENKCSFPRRAGAEILESEKGHKETAQFSHNIARTRRPGNFHFSEAQNTVLGTLCSTTVIEKGERLKTKGMRELSEIYNPTWLTVKV